MTAPVLIVRNAAGTVVFDSSQAYAGVCVGILAIPLSTVQVFTYPEYAGRTLKACALERIQAHGVTIDSALGYPRVTFASGPARSFAMFMQ